MWEVEDRFKVRLGGNTYINVESLVDYKGESLFTLKRHDDNGYLGIYFNIYDASGNRVASVRRNEIYADDKDAYELTTSMTRYTLTERASGRVICDIKRYEEAHPAELDVSVHMYTPSGFLFEAGPNQTNLGGITFAGNTTIGGRVGIEVR